MSFLRDFVLIFCSTKTIDFHDAEVDHKPSMYTDPVV